MKHVTCSCYISIEHKKKRCQPCITSSNEKLKSLQKSRKSAGICWACGLYPKTATALTCESCSAKRAASTNKFRKSLIGSDKCVKCAKSEIMQSTKDNSPLHRLCEKCYLKNTARSRLKNIALWINLKAKLEAQHYKCTYTGEEIILGFNDSLDHKLPFCKFPELYTDIENTQWVTREMNQMKSGRTDNEFRSLIAKIYNNIKALHDTEPSLS
jgi:hypothetical protein